SNASLIYYVKAFADFKEEGINPPLNEVSFNTELSFPKSPTLICGECPRAAKSSTPGHLLLPLRGNSPCMDSANTQQGINPPLNEVSFKIEQGYFMDSPSNIFVYVQDGEKMQIFVGGRAETLECQELSY
ncbi:MAG: hypothetical protein PHF82_03775, partial [Lutispora sp.]|nr:hypothetical protein [Lutispora sp.]